MALSIEDCYAIEQLLHRYCHNADYNPPEAMRKLFTDDAVFEIGAMNVRCEGLEAILAFFNHARGSFPPSQHVTSNLVIEGEGDNAQCSSYLQMVTIVDGTAQIGITGRYMDKLRRTADGWRLSERTIVSN